MRASLLALLRRLTGGRPMIEIRDVARYAPWSDIVSGETVRYYVAKGEIWMATSPWARFRVPIRKAREVA